jgi:hypothetical protein
MTNELKNRLKSFGWRTMWMVVAFAIDTIAQNLIMLDIPGQYVVIVGLVFGEISKAIHNYLAERKEISELEII